MQGARDPKRRTVKTPQGVMAQPVQAPAALNQVQCAGSSDYDIRLKRLYADRKSRYIEKARAKKRAENSGKKGGAKKKPPALADLSLEVADIINTGYRDLRYRRAPVKLYFGNEETGENRSAWNALLGITHSHLLPHFQRPTICSATAPCLPDALAAFSRPLTTAATSAIPTTLHNISLPHCFKSKPSLDARVYRRPTRDRSARCPSQSR